MNCVIPFGEKKVVSCVLTSHIEGNEVIFDKKHLKCARVAMLRMSVLSYLWKNEISEGQNVLVACTINNLLNQLIIMLNGLCRKVHDDVTVLVLPAMLVLG